MPKSVRYLPTHDPLVKKLADSCGRRTVTYGFEGADYVAANERYDDMGCGSFDAVTPDGTVRVRLSVVGRHNISNALAAIAVCRDTFGVDLHDAAKALAHYHLAGRRFELMGEKNGVKIIHDFAHHPAEIMACLQAAKRYPHKKIWVVFQCNSYTRAKTLKNKYATSFTDADMVLVPDIYPGRDIDRGEIHARDLVAAIAPHTPCVYIPTFEEISAYLDEHASPGDIVITLGSGSVGVETRKRYNLPITKAAMMHQALFLCTLDFNPPHCRIISSNSLADDANPRRLCFASLVPAFSPASTKSVV